MEKLQGNETVGMAELMTAQHSGMNFAGPVPAMMGQEDIPRASEAGVPPGTESATQAQPESHEHGVRMAMQLAPWIDQGDKSPLWMPDFETLESLSGTLWDYADPTPFEFL
ncbi:hypothetical protein PHISCL_10546 [Aspergillus sclerotialis]|uniref:Transcription factor n=1 Tax=Aspergillus sclerotialis TaxID=2070753 RepID=A0A3A2Z732_9EURO|nr:hypothetical protein PHISCL_10546 [Aspergillus sclerotialis]